MFGIKKRIWTKQLKRAATVENCLKAGVFDFQMASHGYNTDDNQPSAVELALFAGAVNHILAWDTSKQLQVLEQHPEGAETIQSMAHQLLAADPDLERLVIRVLYEIASLGPLLERDEWARMFVSEHPRIMDVLTPARTTHPELFRDVQEVEFKALFDRFIDKYLPDMKETARALFP